MADFTHIIEEINTNLPDNNTQSITAAKLRNTLIDLTNTIDNVQDDYERDVTGQFNAFKTSVESEFGTLQTNIETEFGTLQASVENALGDLQTEFGELETELDNKFDVLQTNVETALDNLATSIQGKQDTLTFDSTPTENSTNPVTSGGVYSALQNVNVEFESGQELSETYIDDTHLVNPKNGALPTAEDVLQLKAKLEGVTASEVKATIGEQISGYINGDGVPNAVSSGSTTTYVVIPLNNAKSVRLLGSTNSASGTSYTSYAFWNSATYVDSNTVVEAHNWDVREGSTNYAKEYTLAVPNGATYIAVTLTASTNQPNFYCYLQSGESVVTVVSEINSEIAEINEKAFNEPLTITDFSQFEKVSSDICYRVSSVSSDYGKAFSALITTNLSGVNSYRIPIEKGKYLLARFRTFSSTANYGCPILDENDLLVGYLGMNYSMNSDRLYSSSPIPSTAAYIIFTKQNSTNFLDSTNFLELYTEDTRETTILSDALYGREDTLYLNSDSTTDIYNFNYLRGGDGYTPSSVGKNIFQASSNNFKYLSSGVTKYLIPVKGYDTVQFTTFKTSTTYGSAVIDKDGYVIDTIYRTYTADDYLIRPYTLPENACYIAWIPASLSIQNYVILKKSKTYEGGGSDSGNIVSTPNLSFRHGTYSEAGVFSPADPKTVVSSFINLGKPFVFQIHPDYCIKHIFMFDGNGEMTTYYDIYPQTGTSYRQRSYDLQLPQYNIVFEIKRVDGEDIDTNANIVQFYWVLDDTKVHRLIPDNTSWKYFQQRGKQCKNITWKALEKMPQCKGYNDYFFKKGSVNHGIPYSEAAEFSKYVGWNVSFKTFLTAVLNKRSVAYTENISSANRKTNSIYNIMHNSLGDLASNYYGTVCTGLTTYMTGVNNTITSTNWAAFGGMSVVACGRHQEGNEFVIGSSFSTGTPATGEDIANLVQPMDFIWNNGHCSVITDVYLDDDNNRVAIVWTEQTLPRTQSTVYTIDGFIGRLNYIINSSSDSGYGGYKEWKVYRYDRYNETLTQNLKFSESDDLNTPYINTHLFDYSPTELTIDPDICTYEGDYVAWKTNELEDSTIVVPIGGLNYTVLLNNNKCFFNIHRGGGFTKIQIVDEAETMATPIEYSLSDGNAWITQSNISEEDAANLEDWIVFDLKKIPTLLSAGLYKARLSNDNGTIVSGYTHFEMIDISLTVVKNSDNSYRATFSANGGTPYLLRQENQTGMYRMRHAINATELENGYVDFPYSSTTSYSTIQAIATYPFLKLYVQGKYGDVVYRVLISN